MALRWFLLAILLAACGGRTDPVRNLINDLQRYPEYSLIVDDVRIEDGFMPDYFLRFQVMTAAGRRVDGRDTLMYEERKTGWIPVGEAIYSRYENYVGMVVSSKGRDGRRTDERQAHPPAYQYVGNPQYGHWGGGGFWQFYGQYALMRDLMGGYRVGRNDWGDYQRNRERGRPYYGPSTGGKPTFGSRGTQTQKTRPEFYKRQTQRRRAFTNKVSSRMGQTQSRSSWGSRSYRSGK